MEIVSNEGPFDAESLKIALESGEAIYGLQNNNIRSAAINIFRDQKQISPAFYEKTIIAGNYIGFDFENYALPNLLVDLSLLINYYRSAINIVSKTTSRRSNKVFVMGCGPGRLAIPMIELSKRGKLNIDEIVFNDLLADHVELTREKIAQCYGTRKQKIEDVEISFEVGDFNNVAKSIRKKFDVLFSILFVIPEIADFSSVDNLRKKRKELFSNIKKILTKQGIFIEDIPFSEGVGTYYYIARLKTYKILHDLGILEGENDQMLLTNFSDIQESGFPYHCRYVPSNGRHRREVESAGFQEYETVVSTLPIGMKDPERLKKEFSVENLRILFQRTSITNLIKFLTLKKLEFLNYPNPTDEEARLKKTILWRSSAN